MARYISEEDSGPTVALEIEESLLGEFETIGMAEDIRNYVKDEKRTVSFNYMQGGSVHTSPFLHKGVIYFGACDKNMYAVTPEGEKVWRFECGDIPFHPVAHSDLIYFGSYDGNLYAVSARDGELVWKFPTNGKIASQPCISNDIVYFGSQNGNLYALSARDGRLVWKFHTSDYIIATPLVHKGMVLFGAGDGNFYALDAKTGDLKWKFTGRAETGSPAVDEDVIYIPSYDQHVYALDLNGRLRWEFEAGGSIAYRRVYIADGIIYFGSYDTNIYAIDLEGNLLWKFQPEKYIFNTPVVHNGVLYFGSTDYNIYSLDAKTGKKIWTFKANGGVISNLLIHDNKIYFGCWDCNLYCISLEGDLVWKFPTKSSRRAVVSVPAPVAKKISRFIMKPQTVEKKIYKTSVSGQAPVSDTYGLDVGYKTEHEYKGGRKYGK